MDPAPTINAADSAPQAISIERARHDGAPGNPFAKHRPRLATGYHCIICYELGAVKEVQDCLDGHTRELVPKSVKGIYALLVGSDSIGIYVFSKVFIAAASKPT